MPKKRNEQGYVLILCVYGENQLLLMMEGGVCVCAFTRRCQVSKYFTYSRFHLMFRGLLERLQFISIIEFLGRVRNPVEKKN